MDTRLGQCHDWGIKEITCKINWFCYIHRPVDSGDSRPSIADCWQEGKKDQEDDCWQDKLLNSISILHVWIGLYKPVIG